MAFGPGARLGPYEIRVAIGAGGMGEVYKATDTRLDRTVAIKVLPEHVASDSDLKQRFEREAKTLAALSHPHICPIHDVGSQSGVDFLVMEYLEGETLEQRLKKGALPLDQGLQIGIQIADALAAAHRAGIIHRDLKPGNIMLTKSGAKLLDFGLAKTGAPAVAGSLSMLPTTPPNLTAQGAILGTFQYMAPEQLEGQEADARTDIFAFGTVLYEIVTGKKAFEGKSQASLIAAILDREPPAMSTLQPLTPAQVDHVVRRCLAKEPDDRWQSAGDVMRELKWITEANPGVPARLATQVVTWERLAWITVAMVLAAALAVSMLLSRGPAVRAPEMRVEITTPPTSNPLHFAVAPDGAHVAFVASGDGLPRLWVRALDAVAAQPLAGTESAEYPFWSPDSRSIGFFAGGKLKRIDIAGGPPQGLADAAAGRGGAWSSDGTILFADTNAGPLSRISASGGEPSVVTRLVPGHTSHRFPQFLPDDRHFLFFVQGAPETQGIFLGLLDGGEPRRLMTNDTAGAWAPPGRLFFVRQGALVARPFDPNTGAFAGEPITVADPVGFDPAFNLGGFSVSAGGPVAYRAGGSERRQLTWFDRNGKSVGTAGEPDESTPQHPELSPDGRRLAVTRAVQSNFDVWLIDLVRGSRTRFTFDGAIDGTSLWSPDGTQIAFRSNRKAAQDLYLKPSSGAGSEEPLRESSVNKTPLSWSTDGRFLLFWELDPKTNYDLWTLPMVGERKPAPWLNTPFAETNGQFSPDGRWVAYQSNESGPFEIYVQPFPAASAKWQISTNGGSMPRWRPDGKELYFIAPDAKLMAAAVTTSETTFEAAPPVALFQTRIVGGGSQFLKHQYAVSRDGRFLIIEPAEASTAIPLTLILNWTPQP